MKRGNPKKNGPKEKVAHINGQFRNKNHTLEKKKRKVAEKNAQTMKRINWPTFKKEVGPCIQQRKKKSAHENNSVHTKT